jgi:hypothetical protein
MLLAFLFRRKLPKLGQIGDNRLTDDRLRVRFRDGGKAGSGQQKYARKKNKPHFFNTTAPKNKGISHFIKVNWMRI